MSKTISLSRAKHVELTGTVGAPSATTMVTGTVVPMLGVSNDFTSPQTVGLFWNNIRLVSTERRASVTVRPAAVRPIRRRTRRKKVNAGHEGRLGLVDALYRHADSRRGQVQFQTIRTRGASGSVPVKFFDRDGSIKKVQKKYYDLDLDAYQLD